MSEKAIGMEYRAVEMVVETKTTDQGTTIKTRQGKFGETQAAMRHLNERQAARITFSTMLKKCFANYVPGLREATTVVHIPDFTIEGERLTVEQWNMVFAEACYLFGVPIFTGSSIKSPTIYFVEKPAFLHFFGLLGDAFLCAAYGGRCFSEGTDKPFEADVPVEKASDKQDGNSQVPRNLLKDEWGKSWSTQFSAFAMTADYRFVGIAKGIFEPNGECDRIHLNETQAKIGKDQTRWFFMLNRAVNAKPRLQLVSSELIILLEDNEEVFEHLSKATRAYVKELFELVTEENRVKLIQRMGGLKLGDDGELLAAKSAIMEALLSDTPWCRELEVRIHRFLTKFLSEKVIPSGGIEGWRSLAVMSRARGKAPMDRTIDAALNPKNIGIRIPLTGRKAVVGFLEDVYKKWRGDLFNPEAMKFMDGDADGDGTNIITDEGHIAMIWNNLRQVVGGRKPKKDRSTAPLTPEKLEEIACHIHAGNAYVGKLTWGGWVAIQFGWLDLAGKLLELANMAPMELKWKIDFHGADFRQHSDKMMQELTDRVSKLPVGTPGTKLVEVEREGIKVNVVQAVLQYRDMAEMSKTWDSMRDMVDWRIEKPANLIDRLWNVAVDVAIEHCDTHKLEPLSLSRTAAKLYHRNNTVLPGWAFRERNEFRAEWANMWKKHVDADGNFDNADHGYIFRRAREWGETCSLEALAAMLVWKPKEADTDGFSLKWHTVYASGRAHLVLGYHPEVLKAVAEMKEFRFLRDRIDNVANALVTLMVDNKVIANNAIAA